jgi:hypothetical protein
VWSLDLSSDGTILYVGGAFTTYRGGANSARSIAKLSTSDGSLDTTFHTASSAQGFGGCFGSCSVNSLALSSDGSTLYVGGQFSAYRGVAANNIAKLSTSNGNLDTTFYPASSTGGFGSMGMLFPSVHSLALSPDGLTLYVGGVFGRYRGVAYSAVSIAKLSTSSGNLDSNFDPSSVGFGDYTVTSLALSPDGTTLYAGGNFTSYRAVTNSARRIAKLSTAYGALDTSFHPVSSTSGFNATVNSLITSSDGSSLYVGGDFTTYRNGLASMGVILDVSLGDQIIP